jgi:hypothetical protein
VRARRTPWALRLLAALNLGDGRSAEAAEQYVKTHHGAPDLSGHWRSRRAMPSSPPAELGTGIPQVYDFRLRAA